MKIMKNYNIHNDNNVEHLPATSYDNYRRNIYEASLGPQIIGYNESDFSCAMNDPMSVFIDITDDTTRTRWPLLSPVYNYSELRYEYFTDGSSNTGEAYYLSLPKIHLLDSVAKKETIEAIIDTTESGNQVVYEEERGSDTLALILSMAEDSVNHYSKNDLSGLLKVDSFIDPANNTSAAVVHYHGYGKAQRCEKNDTNNDLRLAYSLIGPERYNGDASGKTYLISPEFLNNDTAKVDELWNIYVNQFQNLVSNHPARQLQTYEEFSSMVRDKETLVIAHEVDGLVVSFGMFVQNINVCDWLNTDYYRQKFPDDKIVYFPGIATDIDRGGANYSMKVMDLVAKIMWRADTDLRVVFQCTNISAEYIPRLVEVGAAMATNPVDITIHEMARYNYKRLWSAE